MKIHILDDWFDTLRNLGSYTRLKGHDVTVWTDHCNDVDVLAERLADAEVLVLFRERTPVTRGLLERLPKLKLISLRGIYPHVDVSACTERGVLVCAKQSGASPADAPAELTFALMLASARQIPQQFESLKAGHWTMGVGQTLANRRLGIYGYGRIGKHVAKIARGFGMQVWWWGSEEGRARVEADDEALAMNRRQFFAESDIVTLHVRLVEETRGIISAEDLLAMRPWAHFINTSRAALIQPGAVETALKAGRPGRFALDVFDKEPVTDPNDPIISHPHVIATPHIGFVTEDEIDYQFRDIYDQINAYGRGEPIHMINPEVYSEAGV